MTRNKQTRLTVVLIVMLSAVIFMIKNYGFGQRLKPLKIHRMDYEEPIYRHEKGGVVQEGKPFQWDNNLMNLHGLPLTNFVTPSQEIVNGFVFVMGCSSSHFAESRAAVFSVQKYFPGRKILYFDWGLNPSDVEEISNWCDVELRPFNFSLYPVQNAMANYTNVRYQNAKVYVIIEALREFPAVTWIDTSIRFLSSNLSAMVNTAASNTGFALLSVGETQVSVFCTTPAETLEYLPSNVRDLQYLTSHPSNLFMIVRTEEIYEHVIRWWYLCSMTSQCSSPTLKTRCDFQGAGWRTNKTRFVYQNCTRADQSILNILVANHYQYKSHQYLLPLSSSRSIRRIARGEKKLNESLCLRKPTVLRRSYHTRKLQKRRR